MKFFYKELVFLLKKNSNNSVISLAMLTTDHYIYINNNTNFYVLEFLKIKGIVKTLSIIRIK